MGDSLSYLDNLLVRTELYKLPKSIHNSIYARNYKDLTMHGEGKQRILLNG